MLGQVLGSVLTIFKVMLGQVWGSCLTIFKVMLGQVWGSCLTIFKVMLGQVWGSCLRLCWAKFRGSCLRNFKVMLGQVWGSCLKLCWAKFGVLVWQFLRLCCDWISVSFGVCVQCELGWWDTKRNGSRCVCLLEPAVHWPYKAVSALNVSLVWCMLGP